MAAMARSRKTLRESGGTLGHVGLPREPRADSMFIERATLVAPTVAATVDEKVATPRKGMEWPSYIHLSSSELQRMFARSHPARPDRYDLVFREPGPAEDTEDYLGRTRAYNYRTYGPAEFWAFVVRGGRDEHWDWTGPKRSGIPYFSAWGKVWTAARYGWGLIHGCMPEGSQVARSCPMPWCMNPRHWVLGTETRTGWGEGTIAHNDRLELLRMFRTGVYPLREIAKSFSITEKRCAMIVGLGDHRFGVSRSSKRRGETVEIRRRREERGLARDKGKRRAEEQRDKARFYSEPRLWCDACDRVVPLADTTEVTWQGARFNPHTGKLENHPATGAVALACRDCSDPLLVCSATHSLWKLATVEAHVRLHHKLGIKMSCDGQASAKVTKTGVYQFGVRFFYEFSCACGWSEVVPPQTVWLDETSLSFGEEADVPGDEEDGDVEPVEGDGHGMPVLDEEWEP